VYSNQDAIEAAKSSASEAVKVNETDKVSAEQEVRVCTT
jgi:hypothetical protein